MKNSSLSLYFSTIFMLSSLVTYSQGTLLYSFSKKGKKPSYVFGTIHIKDNRAFQFNDSLFLKMNTCDALALELDLNPTLMLNASKALMTSDEKTLASYFKSKSDYEKFLSKAKEVTSFPEEILIKFKPFAIVAMISQQTMKANRDQTVDEFLYSYAKDNGKPVLGLETMEEQIAITEGIPSEDYMQFVRELSKSEDQFDELLAYYEKGDIESLFNQFKKEMYSEYWEKEFVTKRNLIMVNRIDSLLSTKHENIFVGIGAGHLGGSEGVLKLLQKQGYTVKPIISSRKPVEALVSSEAEKQSWKDQLLGSGFYVNMPGIPTVESNKIPFAQGEELQMHTYRSNEVSGKNYAYVVSEMSFPKDIELTPEDLEPFIESVLAGIVHSLKGKVLSKKVVMAGENKAQQLEIQFTEQKSIDNVRVVMSKNGLYILQVICSKEQRANDSIDKFFDSLRLQD